MIHIGLWGVYLYLVIHLHHLPHLPPTRHWF